MLCVAVLPHMELKPNCNSERAFVWSTFADYADEESKVELLAIRFANPESASPAVIFLHLSCLVSPLTNPSICFVFFRREEVQGSV